jgi:hypothetical protein
MMRSRHALKSYRAGRRLLIIYCVWVKSGMSIALAILKRPAIFAGRHQVREYWNRDDVESMYDKHLLKAETKLIQRPSRQMPRY